MGSRGGGGEISQIFSIQVKNEIFLKDKAMIPAEEELDCRDIGNESINGPAATALLWLPRLELLLLGRFGSSP